MDKLLIELLNNYIKRDSNPKPPNFFVVTFIALIAVGLTFFATKYFYEHEVDAEVLVMMKSPEKVKKLENDIIQLRREYEVADQRLSATKQAENASYEKTSQLKREYSEIKSKMFNEKIIHEEAYQEKISQLEADYSRDLSAAKQEAYDEGVGDAAVGAGAAYLLLSDD